MDTSVYCVDLHGLAPMNTFVRGIITPKSGPDKIEHIEGACVDVTARVVAEFGTREVSRALGLS